MSKPSVKVKKEEIPSLLRLTMILCPLGDLFAVPDMKFSFEYSIPEGKTVGAESSKSDRI
ncbi:MAG: hypothetical protein Pars93KO_27770 [Parasphingorhabdus sp.]